MTDTAYDLVRYPSALFSQINPERMAVLARLAGLDPVSPAEARVLDIGGGDCLNTIAFAAAHPSAKVCGFDLSHAAIENGLGIVAGAGLANVELAVEDILRAAQRYPAGSFDYVIAHGVYAWVPVPVREAIMALIAHVLSDRGVAFVSYNCSAGGHLRQFMRELMFEVLRGIDQPGQRVAAARSYLEHYAASRDGDGPTVQVFRQMAKDMLARQGAVLFHDELGDCFTPQSLRQVCEAAERHGLRHLTDGGRNRCLDGFLTEDEQLEGNGDEQVLRTSQLDDFGVVRYFRQTLLVRAAQPIDRRIDLDRIADLFVSTKMRMNEAGQLQLGENQITLRDEGFAEVLAELGRIYPERAMLAEIAPDQGQRKAVVQLFAEGFVQIHLGPRQFPVTAGERPAASPLVRYQIERGQVNVSTLDHSLVNVEEPEFRALLRAADGSRCLTELAALDHGIPADGVQAALDGAARLGLMLR